MYDYVRGEWGRNIIVDSWEGNIIAVWLFDKEVCLRVHACAPVGHTHMHV